MPQKKKNITAILLLILLLLTSCTVRSETSGEKVLGTPPDNPGEEIPYTNSLISDFDEQVIYDNDGVRITAVFHEENRNPTVTYPDKVLTCKILNERDEMIKVEAYELETEDNFTFGVYNQLLPIPPKEEVTVSVMFQRELRLNPPMGTYTLYQQYGIGHKLGNFRLKFRVFDELTNRQLKDLTSGDIVTKNSGVEPNYTSMRNRPLLIHQYGLKVRYVANFLIPKNPDRPWEKDAYVILTFYENTRDKNYSLVYRDLVFNDKEFTHLKLTDHELKAGGKGFLYQYLNEEDLEKSGNLPWESLSFVAKLIPQESSKDTEEKEEPYVSEPIEIEFTQNWVTID